MVSFADFPAETRINIYKAYMHSDFSPQTHGLLTKILHINKGITQEYQYEFACEAAREATSLAHGLTTRYPQLDLTVKIPQSWSEAKCLSIDVMMSVSNITHPGLLGEFIKELLIERTLLHTRTLELRLVPSLPSTTTPSSIATGTITNRYHTPNHMIFLLGMNIVGKFVDTDEANRMRGVSRIKVSWDGLMDMRDEWTGLLGNRHDALVESLEWYETRAGVSNNWRFFVEWWLV
jgi:hypothetical protein